ncbi:MAG: pyridoxamine 5'-phosphate oxidase [Betaproteobacteria bacterium]|nr:pyridoxamine 5'-phosphate oxidase [Betaproteobacteria bacterium]
MVNWNSLRREYMRAGLSEADTDADPFKLFEHWFNHALAADLPLPNAMALSTVSRDQQPSSRIVLLKGVDHGGFVFYTNYQSRKGRDIAANTNAALLFAWLALERQVRIEGRLSPVSAAESDAYFATRPLGSRIAAIASPQSGIVADRQALEALYDQAVLAHGETARRPAHWGGYRLLPTEIEFWQGRENRLHDRLVYRQTPQGWMRARLAP